MDNHTDHSPSPSGIRATGPSLNSPNDCWNRNGFRVERFAYRVGGPVLLRRIYGPDGVLVLNEPSYEEEIAYCKAHRLMLDEEPHRQCGCAAPSFEAAP